MTWDLLKDSLPTKPQRRGAEVIFHAFEHLKIFDISEDKCFSGKQNFSVSGLSRPSCPTGTSGLPTGPIKTKPKKSDTVFGSRRFSVSDRNRKKSVLGSATLSPNANVCFGDETSMLIVKHRGEGSDRIPIRPFTMVAQDDLTH